MIDAVRTPRPRGANVRMRDSQGSLIPCLVFLSDRSVDLSASHLYQELFML